MKISLLSLLRSFDYLVITVSLITLIIYGIFWFLFIFKKHKYAGNPIEYYFKILYPIPFCIIFLTKFITFFFPGFLFLFAPVRLPLEVTFINDMDRKVSFVVQQRLDSTNEWITSYKLNGIRLYPFVNLKPDDTLTNIYSLDGTDVVYFEDSEHRKSESDIFSVGMALAVQIPPKPILVFCSDIVSSKIKAAESKTYYEFSNLFLIITGLTALWYHALSLRRDLYRLIGMGVSSLVTLYSTFLLYYFIKTLAYYYF